MTKKMRELQAEILKFMSMAQAFMEGETKDVAKATSLLDEADELQKEFDALARLEKRAKAEVPEAPVMTKKETVFGFQVLNKLFSKKALTEAEKSALITGTSAQNGENYLLPEDVKLEINELRKTYISAKDIVTVVPTFALTGSENYESGVPSGLTSFSDGEEMGEETAPKFIQKTFTIGWHGKLIPISRILIGAERAGLMSYLNNWFVKNAILTENAAIFAKLKNGYGTAKAIDSWIALKHSVNVDLDPSCKTNGMIVTNQTGFAYLDIVLDQIGRPILQPNPANATETLFQGMPVIVFPDSQLANIDSTHAPVFYGDIRAGCKFIDYQNLEFAYSEHYGFGKNQNYMRVLEGFDVMSTDTSAYIYGSLKAPIELTGAPTESTGGKTS
ncbi:MAG: phage major capsid protein [Oscillospiraceae bacterium]|nr:phage major capsid protein [Oscillospiraceae bacterium]